MRSVNATNVRNISPFLIEQKRPDLCAWNRSQTWHDGSHRSLRQRRLWCSWKWGCLSQWRCARTCSIFAFLVSWLITRPLVQSVGDRVPNAASCLMRFIFALDAGHSLPCAHTSPVLALLRWGQDLRVSDEMSKFVNRFSQEKP